MLLNPATEPHTGMGHSPARKETPRDGARTTRTCLECGQVVTGTLDRCPHDGTRLLLAKATLRVGTRVGGYEIGSVIGEGGTGIVYRGRDVSHVSDDRPVAIKVLHDRGVRDKDVVEQFIGEGRATRGIRHPNVIEVLDLGTTPDGAPFLVMEYLEGESLRNRLHSASRLPLFEAINILRQVARGLGAAHEAGIVHGALKPADIFLCKRAGRRRIVRRSKAHGMRLVVEPEESFDLVKLLDFGMARFLDLAPGAQPRAGAVSGTLHYLSPEQVQGQPPGQQSDIYSLGVVFYEMITGTVPFAGETLLDILRGHVSGQVITPSRRTPGAGIHMRIDELILRCLKKNPMLRFASTGELCEALDGCITDRAFLRDAHRLSGITESGIDLSQASPEARHEPARSVEKPAAAPVAGMPAVGSVAEKPAAASPAQKTAVTPVAEKPVSVPQKPDPLAEIPADERPTLRIVERPEAMVPDADERPAHFNLEEDILPVSRWPRAIAVVGVLLLGGVGIAIWASHSGSAQSVAKPATAPRPAPVAMPAPPPPPPAAAAATAPAPTLAPSPPHLATPPTMAPVVAPIAPAKQTAAPPSLAPNPPAEMARPAARGPDKLASSRLRPARANGARRTLRMSRASPEAAPPSAKPVPLPETAPRVGSTATTEGQPTSPAPANADELVHGAQQAWMGGHYALAISKARAALKAEPKPAQAAQAYEIIGTSLCAIGEADAAREAASHLDGANRELVKTMCEKTGVRIE